jgi:GMP synthase (glutamine-hydrolysing)
MDIGILQCGHTSGSVAERHGDFDVMFEDLLAGQGLRFFHYDVEHMVFPENVTQHDGWLLTGSKHGAYEDHAFIPPLEDFIRAAYAAGVPQVGICFGHQIIAKAMGGRVEKFAGGWGLGRQVYRMGEREVALNAWHQDQVLEPPEGAEVIATSDFCTYAGLLYGDKAYTLQPHPEFSPEIITEYVASRRGTGDYEDDRMDAAQAALDLDVDQKTIAQDIAAFFHRARTPEVTHG